MNINSVSDAMLVLLSSVMWWPSTKNWVDKIYFSQYLLQVVQQDQDWLQHLLHPRFIMLVLNLATSSLYISLLKLPWPSLWKPND